MSEICFRDAFTVITGNPPFPWQQALYSEFAAGHFPLLATLPTGLGKTSVIAIWLVALANQPDRVPRRLVYVVNRRTVVDQSTTFAVGLRGRVSSDPHLAEVAKRLSDLAATTGESPLAISTLRGQFADNGEWSRDPARPAVVIDSLASGLSPGGPAVESTKPQAAPAAPPPELDGPGKQVWEFLADGPRHVDSMAQAFALPVNELTRTLMGLEMKRVIRRLPGNQFERR